MEKLTEEQEALLTVVRDEWTNFALNLPRMGENGELIYTPPPPIENLESHIAWLYSLADLPAPATILQADSPLAAQQAANRGETPMTYYSWGLKGLGADSGWTAFYDYFKRIGIVNHPEFDRWLEFMRAGIWDCILLEDLAVACRRPLAVRQDKQNRLHCLDGPAIEWADGFKLYFVAGIPVPEEVVEDPVNHITAEKIRSEENVEVRQALIQIRGVEWFLGETGSTIINEDTDAAGMPRRLISFPVGDANWCLLEVECPSKRDKAYLWVPPDMTRCSQACAWTFGFESPEHYSPVKEA